MQKNARKHLVYITLPLAVGLLALFLLHAFHGLQARPTGLSVHVASDSCACGDLDDRAILLHISVGGMSINSETVDREHLAGLLSDIYRTRAEKVLYLSVDNDVSFQEVTDVVNTVRRLPEEPPRGTPLAQGLQEPARQTNVSIELVTRKAADVVCRANCVNLVKQPFPGAP